MGQDVCYDAAGVVKPCPDTCGGDDGFYAIGCPLEDRFLNNDDGTVTDTCTNLMWQQTTADINFDGDPYSPADHITWCEGLRYCEALVFTEAETFRDENDLGGDTPQFEDWRLPNIRELRSIFHWGDNGSRADPPFDFANNDFWSSTHRQATDEGDLSGQVFTVRASNDDIQSTPPGGNVLVRAVRTVHPDR